MLPIMMRIIFCIVGVGYIEALQADKLFCKTVDTGDQSGKRSCASALWDNFSANDSCYMWFPGTKSEKISPKMDSAECDQWSFIRGSESEIADLGRVKLRAFYERGSTGINVTFGEIKWKSLLMRFKEDGYNLMNFCREFTTSSTKPILPEKTLFYDCLWSLSLETREFLFEFKASNGPSTSIGIYQYKAPTAQYINPTNKNLNESELFMYLDKTHLPLIKLHLQTAKERFNIGWESYTVTMHSNTSGYELLTILEPEFKEEDEITYHFQTNGRKGSYYFTAKINHINCTKETDCYVSKSPTIVIRAHPYRDVILIAIAGCGAVILSILSFVYFLWRLRNRSLMAPRPTVLLIYSPTSKKHTRTVVELARFMQKYCHIEALVDELEINLTKSKDPLKWCTDSFSKANAVMVVASPQVGCLHYEGIYRNIDTLSLRLLGEKMADKKLEMKYLTAFLPYCVGNAAGLPKEAKHLRRFYLPSNLAMMLTYVHTGSTSYYRKFCISPLIEAGLSKISSKDSDLVKAINEANEEIREGVKKCSQCRGANSDSEGGPLLASKFTSVNMPKDEDDDYVLVWPEIKNSPMVDEMFPGPIGELNLLGSEGSNCISNPPAKNMASSGLNLNELDLG